MNESSPATLPTAAEISARLADCSSAAERVAVEREMQGLPPKITDLDVLRRLADNLALADQAAAS